MKRVRLFFSTYLAVILILSLSMQVPDVEPYLNALLIFIAVTGFSTSMSKNKALATAQGAKP